MSRGALYFLLGAVAWLLLVGMGGGLFFRGARSQDLEASAIAAPLTGLARGASIRVEGVVEAGPTVTSPSGRASCVAAVTHVSYVTTYLDAQDKTQLDARLVATRRVGPAFVGVLAAGSRLELPLERWVPPTKTWVTTTRQVSQLPNELGVSAVEVALASSKAKGQFSHYSISESLMVAGAPVFVVGRLEDRAGPFRLDAASPFQVHAGSQREVIDPLRRSAAGLRVAGWIFAVLAVVPLAGFGLFLGRERLRRARA